MIMKKLDQRGQGLTEYITLLLLISVISIATVKGLGSAIEGKIEMAKNHITKDLKLDDRKRNSGSDSSSDSGSGSGQGIVGDLFDIAKRYVR